jgi:allose kinase
LIENEFVLGIDVGGTNIRIGLVDRNFQLHDFKIQSITSIVEAYNTVDEMVQFIKNYLKEHKDNKEIAAISIGFPSTIDKERKRLLSTPNIKGLNNIDIVYQLERALQIPTYINKDVNMLMLYDMFSREVPQEGVVLGFYMGTGVGNAIMFNGEILTGKNGAAAELGHIPSRGNKEICSCGNTSCVENFASGKRLSQICKEYFKDVYIGDIFTEKSDDSMIQEFVHDLAIPVATEINIFDPDHIILGGGLIHMKDFPLKQFEMAIHEMVRKPYPEENLVFTYAVAGQENGVIGAGIHAFKQIYTSGGQKRT